MTIAERPDEVFEVVLKARILRGRVLDPAGTPVESALVVAGPASGTTDAEGKISLRGAEPGTVAVSRPAWTPTSFEWDGGAGESVVEIAPFLARAVHIAGEAAGEDIDRFFEMAHTTELNALMLDLKDETGLVWYNSADPTAAEVEAIRGVYDLSAVAARAEQEDLYLIGRIVVFNDPTAAVAKPEMSVWDSATDQPYESNGQYFLDPTDPEARAYGLAIAQEACSMGVDEVQFDYIRFPDKRTESTTFDQGVSLETRTATIIGFLEEAVALLHPMGCAVGADVFGFTTAAGRRWWDRPELGTGHPGRRCRFADGVPVALHLGLVRLRDSQRPSRARWSPTPSRTGWTGCRGTWWFVPGCRTSDTPRTRFGPRSRWLRNTASGWMLWNAASNVTVDALQAE